MESDRFAQSMSGNRSSCVALDIWIESTMNKGSKLKSGWLTFVNNEKQLLSSTQNGNDVNKVRTVMHNHANSKQSMKRKHVDSTCSKIKKDEQAVQDLCACITEFKCDPWNKSTSRCVLFSRAFRLQKRSPLTLNQQRLMVFRH